MMYLHTIARTWPLYDLFESLTRDPSRVICREVTITDKIYVIKTINVGRTRPICSTLLRGHTYLESIRMRWLDHALLQSATVVDATVHGVRYQTTLVGDRLRRWWSAVACDVIREIFSGSRACPLYHNYTINNNNMDYILLLYRIQSLRTTTACTRQCYCCIIICFIVHTTVDRSRPNDTRPGAPSWFLPVSSRRPRLPLRAAAVAAATVAERANDDVRKTCERAFFFPFRSSPIAIRASRTVCNRPRWHL